MKFIQITNHIRKHKDFATKYAKNKDKRNRDLAFSSIFEDVLAQQRDQELELYRLLQDDASRKAFIADLKRVIDSDNPELDE